MNSHVLIRESVRNTQREREHERFETESEREARVRPLENSSCSACNSDARSRKNDRKPMASTLIPPNYNHPCLHINIRMARALHTHRQTDIHTYKDT